MRVKCCKYTAQRRVGLGGASQAPGVDRSKYLRPTVVTDQGRLLGACAVVARKEEALLEAGGGMRGTVSEQAIARGVVQADPVCYECIIGKLKLTMRPPVSGRRSLAGAALGSKDSSKRARWAEHGRHVLREERG